MMPFISQRALGVLLSLLLFASPCSALLVENQDFEDRHDGVDFPVGFTEFRLDGVFSPEVRMVYPAMFDGEDKEMAGNGPFSWTVFIGDSGESLDSYMLFVSELVKRGFIVVVTQPLQDETDVAETLQLITDIAEVMGEQNQTNLHVMGSAGNIDLDHWGIGGHGKGAAAAYVAVPYFNQSQRASTLQPPRSLFGLGLNLDSFDGDETWFNSQFNPVFPRPNTALFITGTVDEVAPSTDTMLRVEAAGGFGWQWMHLLGANHYQFQDSQSFFESDGDATMSQSAQIELSSLHVIAYLDAVLHGDTSRFRDAFNREQGAQIVSDTKAYIDENLDMSSFLIFSNSSSTPISQMPLNATQSFIMQTNWTLRDGTNYSELPSQWDVNVSCGWSGGAWPTIGSLSPNGTATCEYPMVSVAPGTHKAWMRVSVEGAPSSLHATVSRTNTPMILTNPAPTIFVAQHGSSSFNVSDAASDPDGTLVRAIEATLVGDNSSHFGVTLGADGLTMEVYHAVQEEWLGECSLELKLKSDGGVVDEQNTTLRVFLSPVDDPVVKFGGVPQQLLEEDGTSVAFDFSDVALDPEGEALLVSINGANTGSDGPIQFSVSNGILTMTPLPNQYGAVILDALVGDGTTPAIEMEIPVLVESRNDPVSINQSAWENVTMDEDSTHVLNLSLMAYDIDGDVLVWSSYHNHSEVSIERVLDQYIITPQQDVNGVFEMIWFNVSDGTSSHNHALTFTVLPVGDPPVASITSIQPVAGSSTATMQWTVIDVDGTTNTNAAVFVDGEEVSVNHSCLEEGLSTQCVTLIPLPSSPSGIVMVELKVHDDELDSDVVVSYALDFASSDTGSPSEENDGSASSIDLQTTLIVTAALLLTLATLLTVALRSRDASKPSGGIPSTSIKTDEVVEVEVEVEVEKEPSGLLARVNRLR
tara:strand:+ start:27418 stop:30195 length:2778 start_codon:yes stop_codon:yes gene_type:complete